LTLFNPAYNWGRQTTFPHLQQPFLGMLNLKDFSILIHPGLNGSGPAHWHTHWEQAFPDFMLVQQADWDHPVYGARAATHPSPGRRAR